MYRNQNYKIEKGGTGRNNKITNMLISRPLSTTPRMGRQLQRYEGNVRLLSGCIPLTQDGNVVLISSKSGEWILPKGGWERDETAREAAARETYEESGGIGFVHLEPLAEISYRSKRGEACQLLLFVMEVTELLTEWPESSVRQRKVFSLSEAILVCGKQEHRDALQELKLRGLHTLPQHHRLHGAGCHLVDDFGATLNNEAAALPISAASNGSRLVVEEEEKE